MTRPGPRAPRGYGLGEPVTEAQYAGTLFAPPAAVISRWKAAECWRAWGLAWSQALQSPAAPGSAAPAGAVAGDELAGRAELGAPAWVGAPDGLTGCGLGRPVTLGGLAWRCGAGRGAPG